MKASIIALVSAAAAVSAHKNETVPWTTSTVYATSVYTITSCAPTGKEHRLFVFAALLLLPPFALLCYSDGFPFLLKERW
jgi:hypothetical protein